MPTKRRRMKTKAKAMKAKADQYRIEVDMKALTKLDKRTKKLVPIEAYQLVRDTTEAAIKLIDKRLENVQLSQSVLVRSRVMSLLFMNQFGPLMNVAKFVSEAEVGDGQR